MGKIMIFSQTCMMYFILMWNISKCQDTYQHCPSEFYGGYIDLWCSTDWGSICTFVCKTGFNSNRHSSWLTCGKNGKWSPDTSSSCVQSVEPMYPLTELRSTDHGNVITILGITAGSLFGMITIVVFVVWIVKRSILRNSQKRVPGQAGNSCVRPSAYQLHDVTNSPQEANENGIGSVSSFEYLSYDGLYVHPFVPEIPTICSTCKYLEPLPSYNDTPMTSNDSPPTYEEVLTDPSRFYLFRI